MNQNNFFWTGRGKEEGEGCHVILLYHIMLCNVIILAGRVLCVGFYCSLRAVVFLSVLLLKVYIYKYMRHIYADWKNNSDQACSFLRDWRLSASWGTLKPMGPSQHYYIWGSSGGPLIGRNASSCQRINFFSSLNIYIYILYLYIVYIYYIYIYIEFN